MKLHEAARLVGRLKPGHAIEIDCREMQDIQGFEYNGATFTPADRVLENVIGGAYEFTYTENHMRRTVTFHRLEHEAEFGKAYMSPDYWERIRLK